MNTPLNTPILRDKESMYVVTVDYRHRFIWATSAAQAVERGDDWLKEQKLRDQKQAA